MSCFSFSMLQSEISRSMKMRATDCDGVHIIMIRGTGKNGPYNRVVAKYPNTIRGDGHVDEDYLKGLERKIREFDKDKLKIFLHKSIPQVHIYQSAP